MPARHAAARNPLRPLLPWPGLHRRPRPSASAVAGDIRRRPLATVPRRAAALAAAAGAIAAAHLAIGHAPPPAPPAPPARTQVPMVSFGPRPCHTASGLLPSGDLGRFGGTVKVCNDGSWLKVPAR